jgi:small subunit ribosomal protein S1
MVLEIDAERRRISLGIKQCKVNPWEEFAMTHKKGDKVSVWWFRLVQRPWV